jgi:hypothetical protein
VVPNAFERPGAQPEGTKAGVWAKAQIR